jgi:hypothetical protein
MASDGAVAAAHYGKHAYVQWSVDEGSGDGRGSLMGTSRCRLSSAIFALLWRRRLRSQGGMASEEERSNVAMECNDFANVRAGRWTSWSPARSCAFQCARGETFGGPPLGPAQDHIDPPAPASRAHQPQPSRLRSARPFRPGSGSTWCWHALDHTISRTRGRRVAERHRRARARIFFYRNARSMTLVRQKELIVVSIPTEDLVARVVPNVETNYVRMVGLCHCKLGPC